VQLLHLLASGGAETKTLWDPTILGVLTVVAGLVLFAGSTYLLLATNLGARQGFLVAFTGLMAIIMLLSALWLTTNTPLNVPKGRVSEWQAASDDPKVAILDDLADSKIAAVRTIAEQGDAVPLKKDESDPEGTIERGELRPAVEAALVTPEAVGGEPAETGPLNQFDAASKIVTDLEELQAYVVGGDAKNVFWHEHRYAAVQFCTRFEPDVDLNAPLPDTTCDEAEKTQWLVLEYDYGSLRLPNVFYFLVSSLLFGLGLYALHVKERSDEAAATGAVTPATA
jgi:hypothetical protein